MADGDARGSRHVDLRDELGLRLRREGSGRDVGLEQREVAVVVEQAFHAIARSNRAPAQRRPLAVERKVDPEVRVRMVVGELPDLREPGGRDQDARRGDPVVLEGQRDRPIHRVRHAEVVGVQDEAAGAYRGFVARNGRCRTVRREAGGARGTGAAA